MDFHNSLHSVGSSLVAHCRLMDIKHLLLALESASVVAKLSLVEGLRLVHRISVRGTHLIGVRVLLSAPAGTVPMLSVQGVTTGEFTQGLLLEVSILAESRLSL